jgi:hypothetical protein
VAVNCCVLPAATDAVVGLTEIEVSIGAVTVKLAEPLIVPEVAVMVAVPGTTPVANPPLLTLAIALADEAQVTEPVRFWVVPLL